MATADHASVQVRDVTSVYGFPMLISCSRKIAEITTTTSENYMAYFSRGLGVANSGAQFPNFCGGIFSLAIGQSH